MSAVADKDDEFIEEVEPDLGSSVHPLTKKSYNDLGLPVPDSVRLASLRPYERMKKQVQEVLKREGKGEELEIYTKVVSMYRVKDRRKQEFFCIIWEEQIRNLMGNLTSPATYERGSHKEAFGDQIKNDRFEITRVEKRGDKQIFDKPFTTKEVDRWVAMHEKSGNLREDINLYVGDASTNTKGWIGSKTWVIKNLDDWKNGNYEDLVQLAMRGLSTTEPSLHKLKQPIDQDPADSIPKKEGRR